MQHLKFYCFPIFGLLAVAVLALPTSLSAAESFRELIEADWLKQAEAWTANPPGTSGPAGAVSTAADAAGAVDGIKNGKYAFHTNQEPNPWWQVDLGQAIDVARIVVYNRLDYAPGLHNADNLVVLSSDDGKTWTPRHENRGQHFGGVSGAKPLEVTFPAGQLRTRFVRLQIPSQKPIYFHLDEVEIYGPADPKNLALGKTVDQSSVSVWSTAKRYVDPNRPVTYPTQEILERGRRLAADLRRAGVDTQRPERELDAIEVQCAQSAPSATAESNRACT